MMHCLKCYPHPEHPGRRCWEDGPLDWQCSCGKELGNSAPPPPPIRPMEEDDGAP